MNNLNGLYAKFLECAIKIKSISIQTPGLGVTSLHRGHFNRYTELIERSAFTYIVKNSRCVFSI